MYLAGDFTTPPWQLLDMDFVKLGSPLDAIEDVDYLFFKDIQVAEGTWQYKFRVGDSSWWVLNEDRETGTSKTALILQYLIWYSTR